MRKIRIFREISEYLEDRDGTRLTLSRCISQPHSKTQSLDSGSTLYLRDTFHISGFLPIHIDNVVLEGRIEVLMSDPMVCDIKANVSEN